MQLVTFVHLMFLTGTMASVETSKDNLYVAIGQVIYGRRGWWSGEITRLPPVWVWVEFVVGFHLVPKGFFSSVYGFPTSTKKPMFIKSYLERRASPWDMALKISYLYIYLFVSFNGQ